MRNAALARDMLTSRTATVQVTKHEQYLGYSCAWIEAHGLNVIGHPASRSQRDTLLQHICMARSQVALYNAGAQRALQQCQALCKELLDAAHKLESERDELPARLASLTAQLAGDYVGGGAYGLQ